MRQLKREVKIGNVTIGGNHPIAVQTMLNVPVEDIAGNVAQAKRCEAAGCQILRVTCPSAADAKCIEAVKNAVSIPIVADIHFDYRAALACADVGVDKIRINPGNIGDDDRVKAVVDACQQKNIPIRIGVNGGSLEKHILAKYGAPTPEAMVESALYHVRLLEKFDFNNIVISIKNSNVPRMMEAYRQLSAVTDYPLHVGVTEAGTYQMGLLKSGMGIGGMLLEGIGDTIRVSLAAEPEKEVEAGYNILVAQSNEEYEREVKIVHSFLAARVCGVITSLAKDTSRYDHYQELLDNNIPIVFYDRICTGINTERVVVDDYAGSFAAVEYMIQTGCKRIFFYSAAPHLEISKNRRNGYMDAMKKYRIPVDQSMIKLCDSREKAIAITPALLERPDHPDGFFAINDETASGILYSCKLTGRKVPDEVSICGFTDGAIAQSTDPKLTTVEQHGEEVGKSTIRLLIDKLEGNDEGKSGNKIVRTNLVVRGTTK